MNDGQDAQQDRAPDAVAGLCATCVHCRLVKSSRSTFYLCERSFTDPSYVKYPPVPVRACPGYDRAPRQ